MSWILGWSCTEAVPFGVVAPSIPPLALGGATATHGIALSLLSNAALAWNTVWIGKVVADLEQAGEAVTRDELARISRSRFVERILIVVSGATSSPTSRACDASLAHRRPTPSPLPSP
jgi:hypothetical protein